MASWNGGASPFSNVKVATPRQSVLAAVHSPMSNHHCCLPRSDNQGVTPVAQSDNSATLL